MSSQHVPTQTTTVCQKVVSSSVVVALVVFVATLHPILAAEISTVVQKGRVFATRNLAIDRGGIVRFSNDDDFPHQIAIKGEGLNFESDLQEPGKTIDVPFTTTGRFEVRCGIHPRMQMSVQVN